MVCSLAVFGRSGIATRALYPFVHRRFDAYDGPPFAAWYLLASMLDNPAAECLTPRYVEGVLRRTGFVVDPTEAMLPGITMMTRATKPN
jgi:hypothetical protein